MRNKGPTSLDPEFYRKHFKKTTEVIGGRVFTVYFCPWCNGVGKRWKEGMAGVPTSLKYEECEYCNGEGWVIDQ